MTLIKVVGEKFTHYSVWDKTTVCGQSLKNEQTVIKYDLAQTQKLCPKCAKSDATPRQKDWNRKKRIDSASSAVKTLNMLYLFHEFIGEELGIYWGLFEFNEYGCNDLTNFLMNDIPRIEYADKENEELRISYRTGKRREERRVSYEKISDFMSYIKEDVLLVLQEPRFLN